MKSISRAIHSSLTSISDCEKYSMTQNNWKALPTLQTARYGCAAFAFNNSHTYCLCGFNSVSNTRLNSVEMMRVIECSKWAYVKVVSCKRMGDLAVACMFYECASPVYDESYVYDSDYNRRLHRYSMMTKKWEMIK